MVFWIFYGLQSGDCYLGYSFTIVVLVRYGDLLAVSNPSVMVVFMWICASFMTRFIPAEVDPRSAVGLGH